MKGKFYFLFGLEEKTTQAEEPPCDCEKHEWTQHHVNVFDTHIHSNCEHCPWIMATPRA